MRIPVSARPNGALRSEPWPQPALAWWGDTLLAESRHAVRIDEPGHPPTLYFPLDDVRADLLRDDGHRVSCPLKGEARLWNLPGEVAPPSPTWLTAKAPATVDGVDAAWAFERPAGDSSLPATFVAFDHDRMRIELLDAVGSGASRDVTVKRFPPWGDATRLIDVLDVQPDERGRYVGKGYPDEGRPLVEGSQLLGQAMVAAGRLAPDRRAVSAHLVLVRAADTRVPLEISLEQLSVGRTFTALGVRVRQSDRTRAAGTVLLDRTAPDVIRHCASAPPCPGPYDSVPLDMAVTGRDLRVVDAAYSDDPQAPTGPPVIDAWVRWRRLPDESALHTGLMAQFTGHMSIAAALRPHRGIGQLQAHRSLSMAVNAISMSVHGPFRADEWLRYHHESTFAGDGMTHSSCRVYTEESVLVASFAVDAMVRGFAPGRAGDARSSL